MSVARVPNTSESSIRPPEAGLSFAYHIQQHDVHCYLCQRLVRAGSPHQHYTTTRDGTNPVCGPCASDLIAGVI